MVASLWKYAEGGMAAMGLYSGPLALPLADIFIISLEGEGEF